MKAKVDNHIEEIYKDILIKMLKQPEKWYTDDQYYKSPFINKESQIKFVTKSYVLESSRTDSIDICKGDYNTSIHELKISFWDFKTRNLLEKLFNYWANKEDIDRCNKTSKTLKDLLGPEMNRYIKLSKIRKKL